MKKVIKSIFCMMFCLLSCFCLVACGDDGDIHIGSTREDSKWFSQEELEVKGLKDLPPPTGYTGDMSSSVTWFNNGYSFHQECPSVDVFTQNANTYFDYFKEKYDSNFGKRMSKVSLLDNSETWFRIKTNITLQECYDDTNPSKLYQWYYITDTTVDEYGYFDKDAVYSFEIRYEYDTNKDTYMFKIFIENASTNRYGNMKYYYSK